MRHETLWGTVGWALVIVVAAYWWVSFIKLVADVIR